MIKTRQALTLDGIPLLALGDLMMGDLVTSHAVDSAEIRFVGGRWSRPVGRGNRLVNYSWSRVVTFPSRAEAEAAQIEHPYIYLRNPAGTLTNELEGGGRYEVEHFALQSCTARFRSTLAPNDVVFDFTGIGGEMTVEESAGFGETWDAADESQWVGSDEDRWAAF